MEKIEKYSDIINKTWNGSSFHARMPLNERAKIFLPFAALKGFEEAIEERRLRVESTEKPHNADDDL